MTLYIKRMLRRLLRGQGSLLLSLLMLAGLTAALRAQGTVQPPPAQRPQGRENRLQRGREFLGLDPAPDPAAAERGQKVYAQNCGFCHGPTAKGAEGPDLVHSAVVLHDKQGDLVGQVVLKGRPEKGMPAFAGMTPDQIRDIAEFLHWRVEQSTNRYGYKIQNIVTGNAEAGKKYFEGQCTGCHSASGDLAHIASRMEPVELQSQLLYPSDSAGKHRPPTTVTVTLPSGETVSGTLKQIDDFTVSLTDQSGAVRSFSREEPGLKVTLKDPLEADRLLLEKYTDADMHNVLAYLETLK